MYFFYQTSWSHGEALLPTGITFKRWQFLFTTGKARDGAMCMLLCCAVLERNVIKLSSVNRTISDIFSGPKALQRMIVSSHYSNAEILTKIRCLLMKNEKKFDEIRKEEHRSFQKFYWQNEFDTSWWRSRNVTQLFVNYNCSSKDYVPLQGAVTPSQPEI